MITTGIPSMSAWKQHYLVQLIDRDEITVSLLSYRPLIFPWFRDSQFPHARTLGGFAAFYGILKEEITYLIFRISRIFRTEAVRWAFANKPNQQRKKSKPCWRLRIIALHEIYGIETDMEVCDAQGYTVLPRLVTVLCIRTVFRTDSWGVRSATFGPISRLIQ